MPVPNPSSYGAGPCPWAHQNALMRAFHDHEWGEPVAEAGILFEYLVLHTFQLGFDFPVVLKRREGFRELLARFDPDRLARWGEDGVLVTTGREITVSPKSLFINTFCRRIENRSYYKASMKQIKSGLYGPPMRLFVLSD